MCKTWKSLPPKKKQKILFCIVIVVLVLLGAASLGCVVIPVEGELGIKILFQQASNENVTSKARVFAAIAGFGLGGISIVIGAVLLIVVLVCAKLNRIAMIVLCIIKALIWLVALVGFLAASCIPKKKSTGNSGDGVEDCASWPTIYIAAGLAIICFLICIVLLVLSWLLLRNKDQTDESTTKKDVEEAKTSEKRSGWEEINTGVFYNHDNGEYKGGVPGKYIVNKDGTKTFTYSPRTNSSGKPRRKKNKSRSRSKSRKSRSRSRSGRKRSKEKLDSPTTEKTMATELPAKATDDKDVIVALVNEQQAVRKKSSHVIVEPGSGQPECACRKCLAKEASPVESDEGHNCNCQHCATKAKAKDEELPKGGVAVVEPQAAIDVGGAAHSCNCNKCNKKAEKHDDRKKSKCDCKDCKAKKKTPKSKTKSKEKHDSRKKSKCNCKDCRTKNKPKSCNCDKCLKAKKEGKPKSKCDCAKCQKAVKKPSKQIKSKKTKKSDSDKNKKGPKSKDKSTCNCSRCGPAAAKGDLSCPCPKCTTVRQNRNSKKCRKCKKPRKSKSSSSINKKSPKNENKKARSI